VVDQDGVSTGSFPGPILFIRSDIGFPYTALRQNLARFLFERIHCTEVGNGTEADARGPELGESIH
jgi:hypothetical protein